MVYRLLYASRSVGSVWLQVSQQIVKTSLKNNPLHQITGCLCSSATGFLQLLEGPRNEVESLFAKIEKDPRHREVRVLHRAEVSGRRFDSWAMGLAPRLPESEPVFAKYMSEGAADFSKLSPSDALQLLLELRPLAETHTRALQSIKME